MEQNNVQHNEIKLWLRFLGADTVAVVNETFKWSFKKSFNVETNFFFDSINIFKVIWNFISD